MIAPNRRNFRPDLHLVTDRNLSRGRSLPDLVREAVAGGISVVQLREKDCSTRDFLELARALKNALIGTGVPLLINDRVDIALAVDADGVHIGQQDMPYISARELLGPDAIIGLSVESAADAEQAEKLDVDYLGLSPVFVTPTKAELTRQLGVAGVREIRCLSRHRLVAIGGIHAGNAADILAAGADGIAVVSAICMADDPAAAARELSSYFRDAGAN